MNWYTNLMPKVEEVMPFINEMAQNITKLNKISSVYAWGSLKENFNNKDYRIKDIDIIIKCSFDSGDLLAIDNSPNGALKIKSQYLEDYGYNPLAVKFTKFLIQNKLSNVDFWAISKDKKILKLGYTTESIEDLKNIRKESESKTEEILKVYRKDLLNATEEQRKKWYETYENFINQYSKDCPYGWYSSNSEVKKILENSIKIC